MRYIFFRTVAFFLLLFAVASVAAADDTIVRLAASPENPWVGQKVSLSLDVLAKDGWAQLGQARNMQIPGGYLLRLETQGTRLNETIDGAGYTGQRYEFLFFPQSPGTVVISPLALEVKVKSWRQDSNEEAVTMTTPTVTLLVKNPSVVPPGADFVSSPKFSARQKWQPESRELKIGDALTREIVLDAGDVPAMVLPPIGYEKIGGVGIYPASPGIDDHYSRGSLTGRREEKLTYVMEKPGRFVLPDIVLYWWDTTTEKLEKITLPGQSITVTDPEGDVASVLTAEATTLDAATGVMILGAAVIVFLVLFRQRAILIGIVFSWLEKRRRSEKRCFHRITRACHEKNPRRMIQATMHWLDIIAISPLPPRLDLFLARYGDASDGQAYAAFAAQKYTAIDADSLIRLYAAIAAARKKWLKEQRRRTRAASILPEVGLQRHRD